MLTTNDFLAFLSKLLIAGGGGAAVAYVIFKTYGAKWLEAHFNNKAIKLKAAEDTALAELKRVHDQALKEVQAYIDKDLHRATKLYDREFEVLSEAWRLLVKAFEMAASTALEEYPLIDRYTDAERTRLLAEVRMEHWRIDELLALKGDGMVNYYRRWVGFKRLSEYKEGRRELGIYLLTTGVFMPDGMKEKFSAIESMIAGALAEFEARLKNIGTWEKFDRVERLQGEGRALLAELETLIRQRLWSAATARSDIA